MAYVLTGIYRGSMKPMRTSAFQAGNSSSRRGIHTLIAVFLLAVSGMGQDSPHGPIKIACEQCHTADSWVVMKSPTEFDHSSTRFALEGQHAAVSCLSCHKALRFAGSPMECKSCHQDVHRGELGLACERCHTPQTWLVPDMPQRHSQTRFPLVGPHLAAACEQCHRNQQKHEYIHVPVECYSCHKEQFQATAAPAHASSGIGTDCASCHSVSSVQWGGSFDHSLTVFPLTGAHRATFCARCHQGNRFAGTPTQCVNCHQPDFAASKNPPHVSNGISTDCASCHTTMAWQPSTFDHSKTPFALTGAHMAVQCAQCHPGGRFAGTPMTCVNCHQAKFNATVNPPHVSNGISTDCASCHTTMAWQPATFDHNKTIFPLTGAHVSVTCIQCHKNGKYPGTPTACISCHQNDFNTAMAPPHVASAFSTDCTGCHTMMAWQPSTFDHSKTIFPLAGAHVAVPCAQCHKNGQYPGTPTACISCHQNDFSTANAPPHTGFSTDCTTCHTLTAWQPATFNHNNTPFPLTGGHITVACANCHKNNVFVGLTTDCFTCHTATFAGATTPIPHAGFPTACATCHTTNPGWKPSIFDHNSSTFPLTGAHPSVPCASCHKNNVYVGLPTNCYGCHQTDFAGANAPPHTGFSTDCTTCHTTAAWQPATFNHNNTPFPLTGGHITVACANCHKNNVYAGLTTDCYTCHTATFAGATTPIPHAGFPTACATCHTTNPGWKPSIFDHNNSTFPLTGAHPAVPCASCHKNNVYVGLPTNCYGCHQTDFAGANAPPHTGFSTDCTTCHTTSAWQPATFDHSKTIFPLTGGHTTVACANCHVNNVYAGLTTDCYTCHTTTFAGAITPVPHTGFPTACATCHTTNPGWKPSTYSHATATPRFTQDTRHLNAGCAKCHQNAANYTQYCCQSSGCHNTCAGAN
jgi:hypothetical protein